MAAQRDQRVSGVRLCDCFSDLQYSWHRTPDNSDFTLKARLFPRLFIASLFISEKERERKERKGSELKSEHQLALAPPVLCWRPFHLRSCFRVQR